MNLICGINPVLEALTAGSRHFDRLLVVKGLRNRRLSEAIRRATGLGIPIRFEMRETLDRMSAGVPHQGVIAVVSEKPVLSLEGLLDAAPAPALLVVLDGVEDPRNLGAIDGMHVLVRARLSLYEARGDYQLIIEQMEEAGDGALRRAFEELKQRLLAEGLFESTRKWPLPVLPRCIGVITSPTGAAIHDILTVLRRRFPSIPVIVYPVPVQGAGAAAQIAAMIRKAGERADCDVLIVGRGGGSLEDLWPFNEEVVARAIAASPLPIVSAVGHEVDVTIADFAADQRAPTPSAAAEMIAPDRQEWLPRTDRLIGRLAQAMKHRLHHRQQSVEHLAKRIRHPGRRLYDIAQRLDELEERLTNANRMLLRHRTAHLAHLSVRLHNRTPLHLLQRLAARHADLHGRLRRAITQRLERSSQQLAGIARQLDAVSPLATLARGYAIVEHFPMGEWYGDIVMSLLVNVSPPASARGI